MCCRETKSFQPSDPKYHRLLINLLKRSKHVAAMPPDPPCNVAAPLCVKKKSQLVDSNHKAAADAALIRALSSIASNDKDGRLRLTSTELLMLTVLSFQVVMLAMFLMRL